MGVDFLGREIKGGKDFLGRKVGGSSKSEKAEKAEKEPEPDEPEEPEPEPDEDVVYEPARNASRGEWADFLDSQGVEYSQDASRNDLIETWDASG